jgi:hypothetical protein
MLATRPQVRGFVLGAEKEIMMRGVQIITDGGKEKSERMEKECSECLTVGHSIFNHMVSSSLMEYQYIKTTKNPFKWPMHPLPRIHFDKGHRQASTGVLGSLGRTTGGDCQDIKMKLYRSGVIPKAYVRRSAGTVDSMIPQRILVSSKFLEHTPGH